MQEHNSLLHETDSQESLPPLQPLSLTDILDGMFTLYRNNFQLFFRIILYYFAIGYVLDIIGIYYLTRETISGLLIGSVIAIIGQSLLSLFIVGSICYTTSQIFLSKSITSEAAMQQTLRVYMTLLGGFVIYMLVIIGLTVTCIGIPFAVYMFVRWGLYSLPILVEETSVGASLRRSSDLVKGNWARVFGILLAIILIYYMISSILFTTFTVLFFLIPGTGEIPPGINTLETFRYIFIPTPEDIGWFVYIIRTFFGFVINALLIPIGSIGTTLLYFDMRIRKEALDLEMQATQQLNQNPVEPS